MTRFSFADAERAYADWGCNCGPAALAAMLDLELDEVRPHIPGFADKRYVNPSLMNFALRSLGRRFAMIGAKWPDFGLVRIQWEGPWTEPGVPIPVRYRYTHWIGTKVRNSDRGVFDVNCMNNGTGWVSLVDWTEQIAPMLAALYPRATGLWHVTRGLELAAT